jgi:Protein of unknown function (DUF1549)/Protein of unknown function (DUF1553)
MLRLFAGLSILVAVAPTARPDGLPSPEVLARKVDAKLSATWERAHVRPAAVADDAEFLRRVTLDLAGRIPAVSEARGFLADVSADKRTRLVERLLARPGYALQIGRVLRERWLPQSKAQFEELRPEFEEWLRHRLGENMPYDRMIRELLCVPQTPTSQSAVAEARRSGSIFLQANEFKPANLAGSTARMFLGVNIECAQCHDHPHARWTRQQFWEFAAFFADPTASGRQLLELVIPGVDKKVQPHFIDGVAPKWTGVPDAIASRTILASWLTSPDNPYFARHAVNQFWEYLFGTGLIENLDDPSAIASSVHRELLDELAKDFSASGYDLKFLLQALVMTRAYQLTSAGTISSEEELGQPLFQKAAMRSQSGEQLYDSLLLAAGMDAAAASPVAKADFLSHFRQGGKSTEASATILQSLLQMNGALVAEAVDPERGHTVVASGDAPFLNPAQRIESLYLAALTRRPRAEELRRLLPLLEKCTTTIERRKALATLFWALLNSHEFAVIH